VARARHAVHRRGRARQGTLRRHLRPARTPRRTGRRDVPGPGTSVPARPTWVCSRP
jgi:hypothetical protein